MNDGVFKYQVTDIISIPCSYPVSMIMYAEHEVTHRHIRLTLSNSEDQVNTTSTPNAQIY